MKKGFLIILVLLSWGRVIGQVVPEYRIDSITSDSIFYIKSFSDNDSFKYNVSYSIPIIISKDSSYYSFINNVIKEQTEDNTNKNCGECSVSFDINLQSKKILSLTLDIDESSAPFGANGNFHGKNAYTFDLKNKKRISLKDIFEKKYWKEIDNFIYKYSKEIIDEAQVPVEAYNKIVTIENKEYQNLPELGNQYANADFSIDKSVIKIYFGFANSPHSGITGYIDISIKEHKKWFTDYFWELIKQ